MIAESSHRPQQQYLVESDLQSQFVYFDANSSSQPSASRLHFEPGLTLPFYAPAGSLALESRLYQTNYRQQGGDGRLLVQRDPFAEALARQARGHQVRANLPQEVARTGDNGHRRPRHRLLAKGPPRLTKLRCDGTVATTFGGRDDGRRS